MQKNIHIIMHLSCSCKVCFGGRVAMQTNKVILAYSTVQRKYINKVWRFNPIFLGSYNFERVRAEIMQFSLYQQTKITHFAIVQ